MYIIEFYTAIKKHKIRWKVSGNRIIILNGITQNKKEKYSIVDLICGS